MIKRKKTKYSSEAETTTTAAASAATSETPQQVVLPDLALAQVEAQHKIAANWRFCCFALESISNTPSFKAIKENPTGSGELQAASESGQANFVPTIGETFLNCWQAFQNSSNTSAALFSSIMQQNLALKAECDRLTQERDQFNRSLDTANNEVQRLQQEALYKDHIATAEDKLSDGAMRKHFKAWAERTIKPIVLKERLSYLELVLMGEYATLQSKLELILQKQTSVPKLPNEDFSLPEIDFLFEPLDSELPEATYESPRSMSNKM